MNKARLITGVILALFAILVIFVFGHLWFMLISAAAVTLVALEFTKLAKLDKTAPKAIYIIILWVGLWLGSHLSTPMVYLGCLVAIISTILLFIPTQYTRFFKQPWVILLTGLLLMIPAWSALNLVHLMNRAYLFYFVMLVALADTGAYYVGSLCGKHKLAKKLSPKKTWEGLIGGIVISAIAANIYRIICLPNLHASWKFWLTISILTVLFGAFGDLFESLIKRQVDVKDSGGLLPGHGGVYDRFDSLLIAIPIFTLLSIFMGFA